MNLIDLLNYEDNAAKTWIGSRDPRVKLICSIMIISLSIWIKQIFLLIIVFIFIFLINTNVLGKRFILTYLWNMKIILLLLIISNLLLFSFDQIHLLFLNALKFLIFTSTFIFFNKTTSPDKILDLLIKLHFPINLSWTVYTTIRQATLLIEDIIYQNKIQQLRRKDNIRYSRIFKIHTMYMLLTSILSRGITTSIEFADALNTRGWNGPHNKLPLNPTKFTLNDFIFLIITMIFPLVLYSVGKLIIN